MSQVRYVGELDLSKTAFGPFESSGNKSSVQIFTDEASMQSKRRPEFQLCAGVKDPIEAPFGMDSFNPDVDRNPDRRAMVLKLDNPATVASLQKLDSRIVQIAVERSKEWFKKQMTETEILARYKPLVYQREGRDDMLMRVKVKVLNSQVPTRLHLMEPSGVVRKRGAKAEHLEKIKDGRAGAVVRVVPIVSAYSLWFMAGGASFGLSLQAEDMIVFPAEEADELSRFAGADGEIKSAPDGDTKRARVEGDADAQPGSVTNVVLEADVKEEEGSAM